MTYKPKFDEKKTAQLAAYLTSKNGGEIYHLMLMKLLYISDRNALASLGHSITDDNYVAMNYGPVLSNTLALMNESVPTNNSLWVKLLSPSHNYKISLQSSLNVETTYLSEAELDIADTVYNQFGQMDRFELANKTHEFEEWHDPQGSALPIEYNDILQAVGLDKEDSQSVLQELQDVQATKEFLNNL